MAEKLTDRPVLATPPEDNDKVWVNDTSDTTDAPTGTSKQQDFSVFKEGVIAGIGGFQELQPGALVVGGSPSCLLFKTTSNPTADDYTSVQQFDILIYADTVRGVFGFVLNTFTTWPDDLDDPTKFAKFIDNGPSL